jgi:TatD DNase family protein
VVFDTHCHLALEDGASDAEAWLERARAAGVARILDVGIDLATSRRARERSQRHGPLRGGVSVQWTAGLHPNESGALAEQWEELVALISDPSCAAIGETGLDLYRDRAPLARQIESFERHLDLARALDRPVVIHCRDAFAQVFAVVRGFPGVRGVLHCFTGDTGDARAALELGLFVSFAGPLTYPRSDPLRAAARFVPADRCLVETDAPFLPPQAHRGKQNEPAWVVLTLARLAEERGVAFSEMAEATSRNGGYLFGPAPGAAAGVPRS